MKVVINDFNRIMVFVFVYDFMEIEPLNYKSVSWFKSLGVFKHPSHYTRACLRLRITSRTTWT